MQQRFHFRYVNELVGAFVLLALLLLVAGIFFTARSQGWFTPRYRFEVLLPEKGTAGLSVGNEVFILGQSVGNVEDLRVATDGRMRARLRIKGDFQRFVRADSVATIKKTFGVAGDSFVEISRGAGEGLPVRDPMIAAVSSDELPNLMEKVLEELRREVVPVLKKLGDGFDEWTKVGQDLRGVSVSWRQFGERLDRLAAGLEQGKGTAGALLSNTVLLDETRHVMVRANKSIDELNVILKHLEKGAVRVPGIASKLDGEARDLPGTVLQAQKSLHEMERLVEALQRHWLVRRYVEPPATSPRIAPGRLEGGRP